MTTKIGVSLPDSTYELALGEARKSGTSLSGLINKALLTELTRRAVVDHVEMLARAEEPERLAERARTRSAALAAWKRAG